MKQTLIKVVRRGRTFYHQRARRHKVKFTFDDDNNVAALPLHHLYYWFVRDDDRKNMNVEIPPGAKVTLTLEVSTE